MKKVVSTIIVALSTVGICWADSQTPRAGMTVIDINSVGWGPKVNANTSIIDSSAALQAQPNVFTAPNQFTSSAPVTIASGTASNLHCGTCTVTSEIVLPDGTVLTSTSPFTPISVYPATNTASFPFGATASTFTVSTLTVNQIPLQMNFNGQNVVSIGQGALTANSSGVDNTAVGVDAMQNSTIGNSNTALGFFTLWANTSGSNNVAVGREALEASATGGNNTAVGFQSMFLVTSGHDNTAVGLSSLNAATTGKNNTAIGSSVLQSLVTGSSNTAVGFQAGKNELGQQNTYLGTNAGPSSAATLTDAIALGNQAIASSSFTAQIGGLPGSGHEVNVKASSFTLLGGNLTFGDGTVQTSTSGFAPASGSPNYVQIGNSLQPNSTFYVGLASATAVDTAQLNLLGGGYIKSDGIHPWRVRTGPAAGGTFEIHSDSGAVVIGEGPNVNPRMVLDSGGNAVLQTSSDNGVTFHGITVNSTGNTSTDLGLFVHPPVFGASPDPSAIFEADSSTQGALIPRMSVGQRNAISSPANGLVVYDTTSATVDYYNGTAWVSLSTSSSGGGSTAFTPVIVATTTRTNVVADISSTTLFIAPSTGIYTTHVYAVATSSDATAGTVQININYNDDSFTPFGGTGQSVGVTSVNLAGSPGVNAGNAANAVFPFEAVNGSTVTYSSAVTGTYGTAKYNLYISVEQMH